MNTTTMDTTAKNATAKNNTAMNNTAPDVEEGRQETELQRWDRNFSELLQELRVTQTGVQILFGFLLTIPFSNRFAQATTLQLTVYVLTVLACAIAVILLIAPVSFHRRVFRQGRKADLVRWSGRLAQAGLVALLAAMAGAVFLVLDTVAGLPVACPLTAAVVGVCATLWYVLPRGVPADANEQAD
jgi:Family of unknown function (DUF6328)